MISSELPKGWCLKRALLRQSTWHVRHIKHTQSLRPIRSNKELACVVGVAKQNGDERAVWPTFHALMVFLNQEMEQLDAMLHAACEQLAHQGWAGKGWGSTWIHQSACSCEKYLSVVLQHPFSFFVSGFPEIKGQHQRAFLFLPGSAELGS